MDELKRGKGFPLDTRVPGTDYIAEKYARIVFGDTAIDQIMEQLHRSECTHQRMEEDLQGYNRVYASASTRDNPIYQMALQSVREQFIPDELLIPLTLGGAEQHPDLPKDRSPGLPWNQLGYKTKRDCLECPLARQVWHSKWDRIGRGFEETLPDTAVFFRAQIAKVGTEKIRDVCGYPIDVIIEEGRSFYPYMEWLREVDRDLPIAYKIEMATGRMAYIHEMYQAHPGSPIVCTDYSKFDRSVPAWLIRDAFQIIFDSFDWSHVKDSEGKVWPVRKQADKNRYCICLRYQRNFLPKKVFKEYPSC